jgi:protein phosphatase
MRYASLTSVGRVRETNQDAVLAVNGPRPGVYVFAVADGLGGMAGGAEASSLVVDTLAAEATAIGNDLPLRLRQRLLDVNALIHADGAALGQPGGTTVVVVVVEGGRFEVLHAGDSRAYLLRSLRLERLTEDHSWVAEQVQAGLLTWAEAAVSPYRNIVTRAIGVEPEVAIDRRKPAPCLPGDVFLLCSDGLHGLVPDSDIGAALAGDDPPAELARRLVDMANERGGTDNISVVVARVEGEAG